ncbi:hypothetical protein LZK53_05975 [Pseudomonas aeruginosa]|nr:hypothetical protein [Pseudomonas aeruginosa]HCI3058980.1 hypothetical protein [Pseudomonas aeruginosa]
MSEVKRFDVPSMRSLTQGEQAVMGYEVVLASDYDALVAKLAMAEDAVAKGDAARQQCGGMEMEIEELRAEPATLRARVVVVPERKLLNAGVPGLNRNSGWNACLDELARLNGKTVSASALDTLRRFATGEVRHQNNGLCPDELEGRETRDPNCSVCRALIETDKENGNG